MTDRRLDDPRTRVTGAGPFPIPGERRRRRRSLQEARNLLTAAEAATPELKENEDD